MLPVTCPPPPIPALTNAAHCGSRSPLWHLFQEERKAGADTEDLGYMLHRFFQRFGASYDQCTFCVAVGLGGVVTRWHALNSGAEYFKNDDRLATVDPLTGM